MEPELILCLSWFIHTPRFGSIGVSWEFLNGFIGSLRYQFHCGSVIREPRPRALSFDSDAISADLCCIIDGHGKTYLIHDDRSSLLSVRKVPLALNLVDFTLLITCRMRSDICFQNYEQCTLNRLWLVTTFPGWLRSTLPSHFLVAGCIYKQHGRVPFSCQICI